MSEATMIPIIAGHLGDVSHGRHDACNTKGIILAIRLLHAIVPARESLRYALDVASNAPGDQHPRHWCHCARMKGVLSRKAIACGGWLVEECSEARSSSSTKNNTFRRLNQ